MIVTVMARRRNTRHARISVGKGHARADGNDALRAFLSRYRLQP
jgi:hypothetical protein